MKPHKIYFSYFLLIIFTTVSWISSCTHKANISDFPEICFEKEVLPIFLNNCSINHCHNGSGESERRLDNFADIVQTIVPYNPDASASYKAITGTSGENRMPPGQPISKDNRIIIRLWIEQGARETLCQSAHSRQTSAH